MVFIISEHFYRAFRADKCSFAFCFCTLVFVATLVVPFMLAYSQKGYNLSQILNL